MVDNRVNVYTAWAESETIANAACVRMFWRLLLVPTFPRTRVVVCTRSPAVSVGQGPSPSTDSSRNELTDLSMRAGREGLTLSIPQKFAVDTVRTVPGCVTEQALRQHTRARTHTHTYESTPLSTSSERDNGSLRPGAGVGHCVCSSHACLVLHMLLHVVPKRSQGCAHSHWRTAATSHESVL